MKKTLILIIVLLMISAARAQTLPDDAVKADLQKTNAEIVKLYQQKKYDEALPLAQKAVKLTEQVFGRTHLETARVMRNLGYLQNAKNDSKAAEDTFEAALDIYEKIPDLDKANGSVLAEMLELLASIKYQRRIESAEKTFEAALSWREKSDGVDSVKTARALTALANISYWLKDYKKAAKLFQRLLEVMSKNAVKFDAENSLVYYRTECAFRKASMEDEFQPLKEKYLSQVELRPKDFSQRPSGAQVLNSGIVNSKAIDLVKPAFPPEARRLNAEGRVDVQVIIDEKGNVIYACSINAAHPSLMEPSELSAYKSKFEPTLLDGKPIRIMGVVHYMFMRR